MKKTFIILIIAIILGFLLYYFDFFKKITIIEKEAGPFTLIYEEHIGDYKEIKKVQDKIYYSLKNNEQIETTRGFGIYYDNPKKVEKDKLKSIGGCILDDVDLNEVSSLELKYNVKKIEKEKFLTAEFPYKNSLSVIVGVIKIYPVLNDYVEKNNLEAREVMEIYDMINKKIIYLMPLN